MMIFLPFSDSPIQSSCTDTLSLSSPSSDSNASLMSLKRQRIDNAFVMSPKSLHTDYSSSQAKEVMFFQNISLYVVNITFTCYCYHNIFTCCQACQKNSGTKAWRGENPCKICNDRRDEGPSTPWSRQHCCCWNVWKVWVSKMLYGAWFGKVYIHSIQLQIW